MNQPADQPAMPPTARLPLVAWIERHSTRLALGFVLLFLLSGVLTLPDYGITWDEGLGNFFFGERYFRYFTSFDPAYLDFNADLPSLAQNPLPLYLSPFRLKAHQFPPIADTLAAASMYLFAYGLHWLNPIDAFHLSAVLLASLLLYCLYRFCAPRLGPFAAWMAMLLLATFPRFWTDMHFNVKDVPETVFFGLTLLAFWAWHEVPSKRAALLTGLLFGCALGIKANAIFALPILALTLLPKSPRLAVWRAFWQQQRPRIAHYLLMAVSGLSLYLLSWPTLNTTPISRLRGYWVYILSQGDRQGQPVWNLDPLRQAVTTMPEWMLVLFCLGLIWVGVNAWRKNTSIWMMLLLWALLPILRASMPGMVNFDGIRHFLEFLPAAAIIAGYAASRLAKNASARVSRWKARKEKSLGLLQALCACNNPKFSISPARFGCCWLIKPSYSVAPLKGQRGKDFGVMAGTMCPPLPQNSLAPRPCRFGHPEGCEGRGGGVGWIGQYLLQAGVVLILALNLAWIVPLQYPYLHIYYNSLAGGLAGAQKSGLTGPVIEYWGSSYRQGMDWLRQNAAPGARVYALSGNWILDLSARVLLRPDMQVLPYPPPSFPTIEANPAPAYILALVSPPDAQIELAYCQAHYQLVHEISANSVTILQIYRVRH